MLITISFLKVGYSLQIGHITGVSSQVPLIMIVKEYYNVESQSVCYAEVILSLF